MRTLVFFVVLIALVFAGIRASQWRSQVLEDAERELVALRREFEEFQARFEGYWPRYERMEDALGVASNVIARMTLELAAERAAHAPLRAQIEALSAERIAQAAREAALRKD